MTIQKKHTDEGELGLHSIAVRGVKALRDRHELILRPITLLAGANSAGKSSLMQPLLLLKQTLEATFEPPELLLNGPNVKCTKAQQILSHQEGAETPFCEVEFLGRIVEDVTFGLRIQYRAHGDALVVSEASFRLPVRSKEITFSVTPGMSKDAVSSVWVTALQRAFPGLPSEVSDRFSLGNYTTTARLGGIEIQDGERNFMERHMEKIRSFLTTQSNASKQPSIPTKETVDPLATTLMTSVIFLFNGAWELVKNYATDLIHLPGFRGNPERSSPLTAVGSRYSGTFDRYAASIINAWQEREDRVSLERLTEDLRTLGLAEDISAHRRDATQVEVLAPRTRNHPTQLISVADMGFGVSQALPVVVALHTAKPGQLVYIEEPELHLHPRAQHAMAEVLARATRRGVRLIVETHSDLLLLGLQTQVAREELSAEDVALNWFTRNPETGWSQCKSVELDALGSFGDSPLDFSEVALDAQTAFLDATAERQLKDRRA